MFRSLFCGLAVLCVSSSAIAQIRLGVSAPFSGPLAFLGKEVADGANLAANAINAQGGVRGRSLELIFVDDSCRPDRAVESSQKLIFADKVEALLGYPCQQTVLVASRVAADTNKLLIALAPPTPAVQSALHMVAGDRRLGTMVSDLLAAKYAGKRIGLRLSDSNLPFAQALNRALERRSIRAVASDSVPPNTISVPDWMTAVDVAVIGPGVAPVAAVSDFTGKNPNVSIIAPAGFLRPIGIEYPPNLILVANPSAGDFPAAANVVAQARNQGLSTTGYFIYAYAAVQVFASIANKAADFGGKNLMATARSNPIPTVIGEVSYDEAGENIGSRFVLFARGTAQSPFTSIDVCKSNDCAKYEQCPSGCPR